MRDLSTNQLLSTINLFAEVVMIHYYLKLTILIIFETFNVIYVKHGKLVGYIKTLTIIIMLHSNLHFMASFHLRNDLVLMLT